MCVFQILIVAIATYLSGYSVDNGISTIEQMISWTILGRKSHCLILHYFPADHIGVSVNVHNISEPVG